MNKNNHDKEIDNEEIFHLTYTSFIDELNALSQSPEIACELEGHYNVAYEFWYLIPNKTLLQNTLGLLSDAQITDLQKLFNDIKNLPQEAYAWTDVAEESLKNMRHPAWVSVRKLAKELLSSLAPITQLNYEYINTPQH